MYEKAFDFNEVTRKALKSGQELAGLNAKVVNALVEKQFALLNACVENGSQSLESMKTVDNVNDTFALNVELTQKNAAAMNEALAGSYQVIQSAAESYNGLFAAEPVKAAKKKAA